LINIGLLKDLSRVKKYARGTSFAADETYVILKGEVGIYTINRKKNPEMIASMAPGDFFGGSALLAGRRAITATALTDVFALPVNDVTIPLLAAGEPDMAAELIKAALARLDSLSAAYEEISGRPWVEASHAPQAPAVETAPRREVKAETAKRQAAPPVPQTPAPAVEMKPLREVKVEIAKRQAALPANEFKRHAGCALFPEGHGSYELPLGSQNKSCLMAKSHKCPLCGGEFKTQSVRNSRLALDHTDNDMRNHYKGIEPLYYDVITCPDCLYSALAEMFDKPDKIKAGLKGQLKEHKPELALHPGADTFSVFAGYYLALLCAPKCFFSHALVTAKLYMKLSWLYKDCGDESMEEQYARKALETYIGIYENEDVTGSLEQQLCLIIGELSYKAGDMKNAINFLFKAKNAEGGAPYMKKLAEDRIFKIRGID
jgi:uncharacterized protein (DUF2225 family)